MASRRRCPLRGGRRDHCDPAAGADDLDRGCDYSDNHRSSSHFAPDKHDDDLGSRVARRYFHSNADPSGDGYAIGRATSILDDRRHVGSHLDNADGDHAAGDDQHDDRTDNHRKCGHDYEDPVIPLTVLPARRADQGERCRSPVVAICLVPS